MSGLIRTQVKPHGCVMPVASLLVRYILQVPSNHSKPPPPLPHHIANQQYYLKETSQEVAVGSSRIHARLLEESGGADGDTASTASLPDCLQCGAVTGGTSFCGACGTPASPTKKRSPSTHFVPGTPPRKRQAHNITPTAAGRRHTKVPWTKGEVLFVKEWVDANPPALDTRGRLVHKWSLCAKTGTTLGKLQVPHQRGTHVRACFRTYQTGVYAELLES
jgi:hypothetical protein